MSVDGDDAEAKFMRKKRDSLSDDLPIFIFSTDDECSFPITDIIKKLPMPFIYGGTARR